MCGIWVYIERKKNFTPTYLQHNFNKLKHRGPDNTRFIRFSHDMDNMGNILSVYIGFHRLSINDVSETGNQPFIYSKEEREVYTIVNGEIYNYKSLKKKYNIETKSNSDCEVVHELYLKIGFEKLIYELDGEFAGIIIEKSLKGVLVYSFRDHMGVRPLFYSVDENGYCFSSELKGMNEISTNCCAFPPRHFIKGMKNGMDFIFELVKFYKYENIKRNESLLLHDIHKNIYDKLYNAVKKRLMTEQEVGFCLSGGLDSSLICGLATDILKKPINTYTIAFSESEDLINSRKVAEFIKSNHTEFIVNPLECIKYIDKVIYQNETYDCTTVRASILNTILAEKIKEKSPLTKILFVGEFSDEVSGGYSYFHNSPSNTEFHNECIRLLKDIYLYDSLRCDRSISSKSMETRVPFSDKHFIEYYLSINPELRIPRQSDILKTEKKIEKALIREAFYGKDIIPDEVICFKKMAFSDQKHETKRWYEYLQEHINGIVTDKEFEENKTEMFDTKEKYYYRKVFEKHYGKDNNVIPYTWLPKWSVNSSGEKVTEPSATVLDVF